MDDLPCYTNWIKVWPWDGEEWPWKVEDGYNKCRVLEPNQYIESSEGLVYGMISLKEYEYVMWDYVMDWVNVC